MDSEWSMDFAFPLLSLLRANGSEEAAYNKATQICLYVSDLLNNFSKFSHNKMLGNCINRCNASAERDIMKIGLEPWDKICENLKSENPSYLAVYLNYSSVEDTVLLLEIQH